METSYVPPEVLAQAAASDQQNDQKDDRTDDQQSGTSSAFPFPSDPGASSNLSQQNPLDPAQLGNGLSGQDAIGGGEGAGGLTLGWKEQLMMLSPWGLLRAMIGSEPSQPEQQAQQQRQAQLQQRIAAQQQSWQEQQARDQQRQAALREEIESMKAQAQGMKHLDAGSVLKLRTTDTPAEVDVQLTHRALKDAMQAAQKRKTSMHVPKGTQKGPVDYGTLSQKQSGQQMATELPMGE